MKLLRLFFLLALAVLIPFLLWGERFDLWLSGEAGRQWLGSSREWAWALGIGLLVADLILPLPSTAIMSGLGWVYGPIWGGVLASLGNWLAGVVAFYLSRCLGPAAAAKLAGRDAMERYEALFRRHGPALVALSRCLPILAEVISCLAGMSRMRPAPFLSWLAVGSVSVGFAFAWVGASGHAQPNVALGLSLALPALMILASLWLGRSAKYTS